MGQRSKVIEMNAVQARHIGSERPQAPWRRRHNPATSSLGTRNQRLLSQEEEQVLADVLLPYFSEGYMIPAQDLRQLALHIICSHETAELKDVGPEWQYAFYSRHPQLRSAEIQVRQANQEKLTIDQETLIKLIDVKLRQQQQLFHKSPLNIESDRSNVGLVLADEHKNKVNSMPTTSDARTIVPSMSLNPTSIAQKTYRIVLAFLCAIGLRENDVPAGHQRIRWTSVSVSIKIPSFIPQALLS